LPKFTLSRKKIFKIFQRLAANAPREKSYKQTEQVITFDLPKKNPIVTMHHRVVDSSSRIEWYLQQQVSKGC